MLTSGQMRYSPQMTVKLQVCVDGRNFCLGAHNRPFDSLGRKFEDKVGLGEPTENPYDSCGGYYWTEHLIL